MNLVVEDKVAQSDEQNDQNHGEGQHSPGSCRTIRIPCTRQHEIESQDSDRVDYERKHEFLDCLIMNVLWIDKLQASPRPLDSWSVWLDEHEQAPGHNEHGETYNEDHREGQKRSARARRQLDDAHSEG